MRRPRRLLVATGNPGKLAEFRELLAGTGIAVLSAGEVGWDAQVEETGATLEANALAKARAAASWAGLSAVADDTGLFVDRLGGAPGVQSARYAGEAQNPAANCAKLLGAMAGVPREDRGAEFRCRIALVTPVGEEALFEGIVRGRIAVSPRGTGGFGYDSLFEAGPEGRTFAEMTALDKHGHSHRGRALVALRAYLAGLEEEDPS